MKKMMIWIMASVALVSGSYAQKIDEERMKRDIEVAENVLSTLIKQELNADHGFFGMDVKGTYLPGYGVTFRIPTDHMGSFFIPAMQGNPVIWNATTNDGRTVVSVGSADEEMEEMVVDEEEDEEGDRAMGRAYRLREAKSKKRVNGDSLRTAYIDRIIKASKDFVLDYGDFISQLAPNEKIVVTNRGGEHNVWMYNKQKRTHLSIEATRADVTALRQGKVTRDQALSKLKVINTETTTEKEPDMELLSSIFSRLYRPDLSDTYFTEENIYYERLRDYGVIYYMNVYSAYNSNNKKYNMPTVDLQDVDQQTRDKKVVELYPKFEQQFRENVLEYGRTLKTLTDDEVLTFNITLTKCKGCNIPSTLELSVKSGVLKDYSTGKLDKNAAMGRFTVKKGPNQ